MYCRINKADTCKSTSKSSSTDVEVTGLDAGDIYQWEVKVFDENNEEGKSIKDTYKTVVRSKCFFFYKEGPKLQTHGFRIMIKIPIPNKKSF